ncbi:MAG: aspartyl/glutamyl-tRNA amidotransferase subunit B [Nitrospirae bacterium RBG_16_64_22]|nr:MAG: aspartyl/glutamyl-tRNA amidotransferase subunit B [Nitrospirae bacterium RBG_16_64_22]
MNAGAKYEAVIGLEVHAQLLTESKNFCACANRFGAPPNTQTCPVCLGLPGALPVLNRKAVEYIAKTGLAFHSKIAPESRFARKNYFYPDLPKGYQISQYESPVCEGGRVEIVVDGDVRTVTLHRIHLEEDAGKNIHEGSADTSRVDLNRSGVPLMEIVSEPEIRTPEEAVAYLKKIRSTLRCLNVCDGNMEEGSLRCDANVSIRPAGSDALGTKAEIKNVNSFRFVKQAIAYEIERQIAVVEGGGRVVQETRLFDSARGVTVSMRSKEEAHDYRYFPEPDLVPLVLERAQVEAWARELPELPDATRERFAREYGLSEYDAAFLSEERAAADYFEETVRLSGQPKTAANWIMGDLTRFLNEAGGEIAASPVTPERLAEMLKLIADGTISGKIAKTIFEEMFKSGKDAAIVVKEKGLVQVSDAGEIERVIEQVMADNPNELAAYRGGKEKLFGFFVGQVMKKSGGKANPAKVNEILKAKLQPPTDSQ